ncbi:LytR/AlgR family response regulator transcription factor [Intestinibacillus massiliensis]|uniref:LytR/AlgR family response regulator transcription factor n=1 Tax=Intestinibacillus massiliensis TaxID=1871029 RepID=UPI0013564FEC|nr:LytTR family DNA-binding domain-containing protein [Intestinibacillus massiliensis]
MELFIYDGALHGERLLRLVRRASAPFSAADIDVRVCDNEAALEAALHHAVAEEAKRQERFFPMRTDDGIRLLRLSRVLYFQSEGHRIHTALTDGTVLRSRSLRVSTRELLSPLIASGKLLQVSKSTFVNTQHVCSISLDGVHLAGGCIVPVSRKYYAEFLQASRESFGP